VFPSKLLSLSDIEDALGQVTGDGAYDQRQCYDAIRKRRAKAVIPPCQGAKIWQHGNCKAERHQRDENLCRIRKGGRKAWKEQSNYHRRSLAETTLFQFKTVFGGTLSSRCVDSQAAEIFIKCGALNRMIQGGKPDSYRVEA